MRAPAPRYRVYTRASHYASVALRAARGWSDGAAERRQLETSLREYLGVEHAVPMPQNRVGIYFAVRALVRPGKKVVLSPYTLSDVVNMVVCAGAVPVFADTERETCNIDPQQIERLVDDDTDAVLVTHLHGLVCDMNRIVPLCRQRRVNLIEDAAQAFGAKLDGRPAGSFGDAGVYSFGLYKNLTSFMGGALVTPHAHVAQRVRTEMAALPEQPLRSRFGKKVLKGLATDVATYPPVFKSFTFWVFQQAYLREIAFLNRQVTIEHCVSLRREVPPEFLVQMSGAQAELVRAMLPTVAADSARRIEAARLYHRGLHGLSALRVPPFREDGSHIYTYYPIQVPDRRALTRSMVRQGRDVAVQHLRNCADIEAFVPFFRECPNARLAGAQTVLLSTYPRFPLADVERNVSAIRDFFGGR